VTNLQFIGFLSSLRKEGFFNVTLKSSPTSQNGVQNSQKAKLREGLHREEKFIFRLWIV
jgi:hypothetical protein